MKVITDSSALLFDFPVAFDLVFNFSAFRVVIAFGFIAFVFDFIAFISLALSALAEGEDEFETPQDATKVFPRRLKIRKRKLTLSHVGRIINLQQF